MDQAQASLADLLRETEPLVVQNITHYLDECRTGPAQTDDPFRHRLFASYVAGVTLINEALFDPNNSLSRYRLHVFAKGSRCFNRLAQLWACELDLTGLINRVNTKTHCHLFVDGMHCATGEGSANDLKVWLGYMDLIEATYDMEQLGADHSAWASDYAVDFVLANFCAVEHRQSFAQVVKAYQNARDRMWAANLILFSVLKGKEIANGMKWDEMVELARSLPLSALSRRISSLTESADWRAATNAKFDAIGCRNNRR